ncbi:uncharacterized protein bub1ba [Parambassis ranga]|uniref:Uncharacterized protein bub1ba n=1 Tax=Parambassis ranga TaxID=210632 RepID=A0A6P7HE26_9TELE|nr:uncharacterized protein LOC114429129 [Parambassis ranga]
MWSRGQSETLREEPGQRVSPGTEKEENPDTPPIASDVTQVRPQQQVGAEQPVSTCQRGAQLSGGEGPQETGAANQRSSYCKDQLMRGEEELSFEELRAERYNQRRQRDNQDKLTHLTELKQQLSLELEERKKLLLQSQQLPQHACALVGDSDRPAAFFQIHESRSAAARPAGRTPSDELLHSGSLPPDERGLSVKIQYPGQPGHQGATAERLQTRPAASKDKETLSPIQEASVEAASLGALSAGSCGPLQGEREGVDGIPVCAGGAVSPCDPDLRRRLLDQSDVTSSPDFHSESCPLPAVEEHSCLYLGGEIYFIHSKTVAEGSFSIFKGVTEDQCVLIKVDSCTVPWDFYQFMRLKKNWSAVDGLPLISCFLFLDGCVTVYTTPPNHMFTELMRCAPAELAGYRARGLLRLVSQLHSCRLLHAALQPSILTRCYIGFQVSDCVIPVDWSSSVDLDLQPEVSSVQRLPSAQSYINLGLLEPSAPPQLVDLVGVAESVHLLLTGSRMVLRRDPGGWMVEGFSGDEPCDLHTRMWRRFFYSLLNAAGRSSLCVLSELEEQLSTLYQ